ncbi:MAG: chromate efflux transporter [Bacteroidota bacterium]
MKPLREVALLFLKLGTTAFGGPAAHIAMMEQEVVVRRKWVSREYFLDLLGATNLIPGPNSTEMAIHIGYVRAGWRGVLVAGICFIAPAVLITLLLAHLYVTYGTTPQLEPFIYGIRAAIIAVILGAVIRLGKPLLDKRFMLVTGLAVIALNLLHVDEILLLLCAGILGILWENRRRLSGTVPMIFLFGGVLAVPLVASSGVSAPPGAATLTGLGLFFLKIGSILYGSGYVLVAFLQGGLVESRHWLTQTQLLDAIAIGQFTPGPVLSTATFIGYVVLGIPGAAIATTGIFFPSFVFVLLTSPFVPRLRRSAVARGFLEGVSAASLGLMLGVCLTLGSTTLTSIGAWTIFLLAVIVLSQWSVNAAWIVGGSSVLGWLFSISGM